MVRGELVEFIHLNSNFVEGMSTPAGHCEDRDTTAVAISHEVRGIGVSLERLYLKSLYVFPWNCGRGVGLDDLYPVACYANAHHADPDAK